MKNFSKKAISFILMVKRIGNKDLNNQAIKNKKNEGVSSDVCIGVNYGDIGKNINNLSIVGNLTKFKKPNSINSKKIKNLKSVIANTFETDFLTPEAKKVFIHL